MLRICTTKGVFDLAAFNLEQYCQFMLKSKLLVKTKAYFWTSSPMKLVRALSRISPELMPLLENDENVLYLTKIEDFYIGARYLPRRFERVEVKGTLNFVKDMFKTIVNRI
jgi:HEPN domain-containing protein